MTIVASSVIEDAKQVDESYEFRVIDGVVTVRLPRVESDVVSCWAKGSKGELWLIAEFEDARLDEVEKFFEEMEEDTGLEIGSGGWNVAGQVVDRKGCPISGVDVDLIPGSRLASSPIDVTSTTDTAGHFEFGNLNHGNFWVVLQKEGFAIAKHCPHQFRPEEDLIEVGNQFTLPAGTELKWEVCNQVGDVSCDLMLSWENQGTTGFTDWYTKVTQRANRGVVSVPSGSTVFVTLICGDVEVAEKTVEAGFGGVRIDAMKR